MSSPVPDSGRPIEDLETQLRVPSDLFAGVAMVAFGTFFLVNSGEELTDWIWPRSLSQILIVLGVVLAVRGLTRNGRRTTVPVVPRALRGRGSLRRGDADVLLFAVAVVVFVAFMNIVGFWLLTFLMFSAAANLLDPEPTPRKRVIAVVAALAVAISGYVLFEIVFYVPFPNTPGLPF